MHRNVEMVVPVKEANVSAYKDTVGISVKPVCSDNKKLMIVISTNC